MIETPKAERETNQSFVREGRSTGNGLEKVKYTLTHSLTLTHTHMGRVSKSVSHKSE